MLRHRRAKLTVLAAATVFGALGGVAVAASTNSLPFAADNGQTTAATRPSPGSAALTPPSTAVSASAPEAATPAPASELGASNGNGPDATGSGEVRTVHRLGRRAGLHEREQGRLDRVPGVGIGRRWRCRMSPTSVPTRPPAAETRRRLVDLRARRTVRGTSTPTRPAPSPGPRPDPGSQSQGQGQGHEPIDPTPLLSSSRPVPGCRPGGLGALVTHAASSAL